MSWGPLHSSAFTGSLFGLPAETWCVWFYAIATADEEDVVELNPLLLAPMFSRSEGDVRTAIQTLMSPDSESRTEEESGARLRHLGAFSYFVINREKYRNMIRAETRRGYNRLKKQESRARQQESKNVSTPCISTSSSSSDLGEEGVRREETKKREKKILQSYKADAGFMAIWEAYPAARRVGALKAFEALVNARKRPDYPGDAAVLESLRTLVEEDWRFREPKFIKHPSTWLNSDGWEDVPAGPSWEERRRQAKERMVSGHQGPIDPLLGG